jgi:hypothetical protein
MPALASSGNNRLACRVSHASPAAPHIIVNVTSTTICSVSQITA